MERSSLVIIANPSVVIAVIVVVGVAAVPLAVLTGSSFPFLVAQVVPSLVVAPMVQTIAILINQNPRLLGWHQLLIWSSML